jgi:uncharacterized membrane protein
VTNQEAIVRQFLQKAHDRNGGTEMTMLMMAERILLLEDALACAQIHAAECAEPAPDDDRGAENERLRSILATIVARCDRAKQDCKEGAPVSAFNLASGILGQIGSDAVALRASLSQHGGS